MKTHKRVGIPHFENLPEADKKKLLTTIFADPESVVVREKVDGARITFGSFEGKFFVETSRSGKIFQGHDFVNYAKERGKDVQRAHFYNEVFLLLEKLVKANDLFLQDWSVTGDFLYTPMSELQPDGSWVMVKVPYRVPYLLEIYCHDFSGSSTFLEDLILNGWSDKTTFIKFLPIVKVYRSMDLASLLKQENDKEAIEVIIGWLPEIYHEVEGFVISEVRSGITCKLINPKFRTIKSPKKIE